MAYTEAHKRATEKYRKAHLEQVNMRFQKGIKQELKDIANKHSMSLPQMVVTAIRYYDDHTSEEK